MYSMYGKTGRYGDLRGKRMKETEEKKGSEKRTIVSIFVFFALTAGCIVFAILCFFQAKIPFIIRHATLLTVLSCVLLCALCALSIWLLLAKKEALAKTLLSVYIFLLFCLVLWFILLKTGFFEVIRDADSLQNYLENAGVWMPLFYIALQYLQVVILPIPSVVSTAAGVALFGPFWTTVYSLIGIILGSLTAFIIGRKLGHKAVAWMVGEDSLKKWQTKLKGKDNLVLTLMFLLPLFPDDILCFIAGLSSMSFLYFIIMVAISRILAVSATCYSIDLIPFNTWWGLLIWGVFFALIIVAFIVIYKNLDRIQNALSKRFKFFRKKK